MNPCDPALLNQIPVIQKIIEDETWLESERRGCAVSPNDRVVKHNVCEVILRIGQQLRDSVKTSVTNAGGTHPSVTPEATSAEKNR